MEVLKITCYNKQITCSTSRRRRAFEQRRIMRFQVQNDIFSEGYLLQLATSIIAGEEKVNRLSTNELSKIPEIYAKIDYNPESEGCILDYIEADKVYKTGNGQEIVGADIRAITSLMYLKPRSAYWKPDKPQIHDSSVGGGVPLAMLGFKRWKGINYYDWYKDQESVQDVYNVDILLGKTLASTVYDFSTDMVSFDEKGMGLVLLTAYKNRATVGDIKKLRTGNTFKNHHFASGYGASKVAGGEDNPIIKMHNLCNTPMRLMMSQRWVWYGKHRNSDMICDYGDWDNIPKSVDDLSVAIKGEEPQVTRYKALKERFGIG